MGERDEATATQSAGVTKGWSPRPTTMAVAPTLRAAWMPAWSELAWPVCHSGVIDRGDHGVRGGVAQGLNCAPHHDDMGEPGIGC